MRAVLLGLSFILVQVSGFSIRAPRSSRGASGNHDNSLSEALRVLEREKRRLDDEASHRDDWEPRYYENWAGGDGTEEDDVDDEITNDGDVSNDIADYLANLLRYREPTEEDSSEDQDGFKSSPLSEGELNPADFRREDVSRDELKSIFNDDSEPGFNLGNVAASIKKRIPARKKKTPEVENSMFGDRERLSENMKAEREKEKQKAKEKKNIPRGSIDLQHLSRSEIQELLDEVDQLEKEEVIEKSKLSKSAEIEKEEEEVESPEPETEPVSEEELEDVFSEDGREEPTAAEEIEDEEFAKDGDGSDEEIEETKGSVVVPVQGGEIRKEWLSRNIYHPDERIKRLAKRGSKKRQSDQTLDDYRQVSQVSRLLEIIGKLRLKNILENKEIDYLADALDMATNSQAQQSYEKLPNELLSLQRAIKIEESLQDVDSTLSVDDKQYLDIVLEELISSQDNIDVEDGLEAKKKRDMKANSDVEKEPVDDGAPAYEDTMGQWYDSPVVDGKYNPRSSDEEEEEEAENEVSNKILEDLIDRYGVEEVLASLPDEDDDEVEDEAAEDEEIPAEEGDFYPTGDMRDDEEERSSTSTEYQDALARLFRNEEVDQQTQEEIEQALAQFRHNVEPWQRRELENKIRDYDQCYQLDDFVSDCRLADQLNIPVDDEARELCSRHEACYACGPDLGKAANQCDAGYLAEALELCGGVEKCGVKADAFLRLMQYYHRYSAASKSECQHQCVMDYIYGVSV